MSFAQQAFIVFLLVGVKLLVYWASIESVFYSLKANVNVGVVLSLYLLRPTCSAIVFYLLFGQKLMKEEIIAFILCIISIIFITTSKSSGTPEQESQFKYFIISLLLKFFCMAMTVSKNVIMRMFFVEGHKQLKVVSVQNNINLCVALPLCGWLLLEMYTGFEFENIHLFIGSMGGIINMLISFTGVYAVVKGKAGSAEVLIGTSIIMQVVVDAFIYGRIPNLSQCIGVTSGFIGSVLVIYSHLDKKKKK